MVTALKPGPFSDSLCMQPATTLDELRQRATKYMQLEELKEFRSRAQAPDEPERRKDRSKPTHFGKPRDFPKGPRFTRYTPLTAERSRVLEEAINADLLKAPSRTPTPQSADQTKHCRYHLNFGHTTEDCWALKDKIEELIQAGHLRRFVQTSREDGKKRG